MLSISHCLNSGCSSMAPNFFKSERFIRIIALFSFTLIISSSDQKTYPCSLSTFLTIASKSEKEQSNIETTNVLGMKRIDIYFYFKSIINL